MRIALLAVMVCSSAVAAEPAFEVASIRPHQGRVMRSGPFKVSGPIIRLEGYTVFGLVLDAFDLNDYQLSFGKVAKPEEVFDTMYDVVARAPGPDVPTVDSVRAMLRTMLAERFGFAFHREPKEMQTYALVVAKTPAAFTPGEPGQPCSLHSALAKDGRNREEVFTNCDLQDLTDRLTKLVGNRPVLDQTNLKGAYNFRLLTPPSPNNRIVDATDADPMTAVQQLGLKLVPQESAIDIYVVDRVQKPTEN